MNVATAQTVRSRLIGLFSGPRDSPLAIFELMPMFGFHLPSSCSIGGPAAFANELACKGEFVPPDAIF
jgi:hypothetical protein